MLQEDNLGKWLEDVEAGRPACVFTDDVEDTSNALEQLLTSEREPTRVVTLSWQRVPALSNELRLLVDALAEATLRLYPQIYGLTHSLNERWPEADLETAVHEIRRRVPDVLGAVCRQILTACRKGQSPLIRRLSNTEQVRQLALAIEPQRLVLLVAVHDAQVHSAGLKALAQGAGWLATNSKARVILVLPKPLHTAAELDHVTYTACVFTPAVVPENERLADFAQPIEIAPAPITSAQAADPGKPPPAIVSISPILGKPHPRSEVEKALYERICADTQLSQFFSYNQRVETRYESTPTVDLLSAKHKLVIEIDGDDHRRLLTWTNDRKRDVELLLSGYRVMRFASSTLVENTELVLSRIRDAVQLLEVQEKDR